MATASCDGLAFDPTPEQLKAAGFITTLSDSALAFGCLVGILSFGCFVPQVISISRLRSTFGVSSWFVALTLLSSSLQLAAVIGGTAPQFIACEAVDFRDCFASILPFCQLVLQALGALLLFVGFSYFWIYEERNQILTESFLTMQTESEELAPLASESFLVRQSRKRVMLLASFSLSVLSLLAVTIIPFVEGACAPLNGKIQNVNGVLGTIFGLLGPLPQILLLYRTKDPGTLSLFFFVMLVVGGVVYTLTFITEHAATVVFLPFLAQIVEGSIVIGFAMYYKLQKKKKTSESSAEITPLAESAPGDMAPS